MIIRAFRIRGHLKAKLAPLEINSLSDQPELDPKNYGFVLRFHLLLESFQSKITKYCENKCCKDCYNLTTVPYFLCFTRRV